MRPLTELERSQVYGPQVQAAHDRAERILKHVRLMRTLWIRVAEDVYEFNELEQWRDLGYQSFEAWLAEPTIGIKRRTAYYLIDVWRHLVIDKGVKPERLETLELSRLQEVLPAVRRGQVTVDSALADAETLAGNDLRDRYRGNGNAQPAKGVTPGPDDSTSYEATAEPEYVRCPTCRSRVRAEQLQEASS